MDFSNTVICMTSNAGSSDQTTASLGFNRSEEERNEEKSRKALSQFLRPEFLGRVDEVITFKPLSEETLQGIAALMLDEYKPSMEAKGIAYVEKTGNTNDEIMTAASSMVGQVDAVFTPTDNVVMAAAAAVSETLTKGGIPFYTGADSFVTAGAFATCGVNYTELGTYTADMALDILETGVVPAYHVMDGGIITVNTETAAALGIDYSAFNDLAGQVVEVTTAE